MLAEAPELVKAVEEIGIKKVFKTDRSDSAKSVVQFIDSKEDINWFIFGGFDKTLRLGLIDDSNKRYQIIDSVHFEGLPLKNCFFSQ